MKNVSCSSLAHFHVIPSEIVTFFNLFSAVLQVCGILFIQTPLDPFLLLGIAYFPEFSSMTFRSFFVHICYQNNASKENPEEREEISSFLLCAKKLRHRKAYLEVTLQEFKGFNGLPRCFFSR
jgi:hypothetical protein